MKENDIENNGNSSTIEFRTLLDVTHQIWMDVLIKMNLNK